MCIRDRHVIYYPQVSGEKVVSGFLRKSSPKWLARNTNKIPPLLTPRQRRATVTVSWAHHGQLCPRALFGRQHGTPPSASRARPSRPFSPAPLTVTSLSFVRICP